MQVDDDTKPQNARDRRLARDDERERVRAALRFAAHHGYYVFDELVTENAGTLDYLAVGPPGATAVIVREDEGIFIAEPYTHEWFINGYHFEDNPRQQADEMTDDIVARLTRKDVPVDFYICFTRAEIRYSRNPEAYKGVTRLWTLPRGFERGEAEFNPADVAEIADDVERIYGRPPFVKPISEQGSEGIV